jgi:ferritin-like metal-binding protein YciE/outer membrane biosynthesis protein TonB
VNSSASTIASYLQDAQVLEGSLRRTLIAHIAVSARDEHRSLLEDHLRVTTAQERRLGERLAEIGGGPNPVQSVLGAAKGAGALVLTLAKGPADALRGPTGDDVTLRNAQDECASEQLEIAVYTAIEALATELGDEQTAELARRHRKQEEQFLEKLTDTVPELARNVARNRNGGRRFPLPTIGAIDAARALVTGAQAALRSDDSEPEDAPSSAASGDAKPNAFTDPGDTATTPRQTAPVKQAGAPTPPSAPAAKAKAELAATPKPKPSKPVPPSAKDVPEPQITKSKPKRTRATPAAAAATTPFKPRAAKAVRPKGKAAEPKPAVTPTTPPIGQYDDMTPYEIGELLDHLPADKLDAIEWYEKSHENREQVLEAVAKQRETNAAQG